MRGQGASDKIAELNYADMADDILEFIDKLNMQNPYYFGFNDGGIVGLLAAAKRPNIFRKMLIAGTNTNPKAIKKGCYTFFKLWYCLTRNKILKAMLFEPSITAVDLQKISIETIITMGQRDCIYEENGKFIAAHMQNAKLIVLKKENHISYVFNNTKLTKLIREYLLHE